MEERYCLRSDNDGHDYCILVYQKDEFDDWVEFNDGNSLRDEWYGFDFNEARVEGNLTFSNPYF